MQLAFREGSENLMLTPTDKNKKKDQQLIAALVAVFAEGGTITVSPNDEQPEFIYHLADKGKRSTGKVSF